MLTCSQWQHVFYVHHPSLACKLKFGKKKKVQLRLMGMYLQMYWTNQKLLLMMALHVLKTNNLHEWLQSIQQTNAAIEACW